MFSKLGGLILVEVLFILYYCQAVMTIMTCVLTTMSAMRTTYVLLDEGCQHQEHY